MYADDTHLIHAGDSADTIDACLNVDLANVSNWLITGLPVWHPNRKMGGICWLEWVEIRKFSGGHSRMINLTCNGVESHVTRMALMELNNGKSVG